MSVTVKETPYMFGWARNKNRLQLLCNGGSRANYAIAAKVKVWVNDCNSIQTYVSEVMVFHPDNDGIVNIPLDLLAWFIPQPDMPNGEVFALLTNAVMKYQVLYGEMYGTPTPSVAYWASDSVRYAVCGEVAERYSRLNLPDWKSGMVRMIADSDDVFWVVGEDTDCVVRTRRSQPVYLYGLWYKAGSPFTATVNVTVTVRLVMFDGTESTTSKVYTPTNGSVYRLDVSPSTFGSGDDIVFYEVTVRSPNGSWNRTYHISPDGCDDRQLLLQNKYGVLIPWVCAEMKRELTLESEHIATGRLHYTDQTAAYEVHTAIMPAMAKAEAERLARCLGQRYHYIKSGYAWLRIVVEPNTFTILEEGKDMVRVQFSFRFTENQQENMSEAPRSVGMTFNYDDAANEIVAFSDRTVAINNELL